MGSNLGKDSKSGKDMKAILLNGSRDDDDTLNRSREIVTGELRDRGWEVQEFLLGEIDIFHCLGCFGCWVKTPGLCVIKDSARDIARMYIRSDLAVLLTPVTFGGYSSELKKALDRIICVISPFFKKVRGEVHHRPRYDRYPRLMAIGVLPETDAWEEDIFSTLVERNAINLYAPSHVVGILFKDQSNEAIQSSIRKLLRKIGVNQ